MKKNKKTAAQNKSAVKRGAKRSARIKKTQGEKNTKKMVIIAEKKRLEQKQNEEIMKIINSRRESIS